MGTNHYIQLYNANKFTKCDYYGKMKYRVELLISLMHRIDREVQIMTPYRIKYKQDITFYFQISILTKASVFCVCWDK